MTRCKCIVYKDPKMGDIVTIVIPKISAQWDQVAYALYFEPPDVDAIAVKCLKDPQKCCQEVFIEWLYKGRGTISKTWSVLLETLKKIGLVKAVEDITEELYDANQNLSLQNL